MDVKIYDGNYVITLPISKDPKSTDKMFLTGSSGGWKDTGLITPSGQPLRINVMIGYKK